MTEQMNQSTTFLERSGGHPEPDLDESGSRIRIPDHFWLRLRRNDWRWRKVCCIRVHLLLNCIIFIYIFIRQKGSSNKWKKHQTHNLETIKVWSQKNLSFLFSCVTPRSFQMLYTFHCLYLAVARRMWAIISTVRFNRSDGPIWRWCDLLATAKFVAYDTIRYDSVYLTCSKKLTSSQLSLPHRTNKKLKCKTKNKMMTVIGFKYSCT